MLKPAYQGKGKYIFISYAHKDKKLVSPFIEAMQARYNVWYDEGIKYGKEWTAEILEKLEGCTGFLFLVSENSLASENCKDEIHAAREYGKNFINIIFDMQLPLPKDFLFRYGRYQLCQYQAFGSAEECINDLSGKCDWFNQVVLDPKETKEAPSPKKPIKAKEDDKKEQIEEEAKPANSKKIDAKEDSPSDIKAISEAKRGDIVTFGRFPQDNGQEPLRWIVIYCYDDALLLMAEKVLFAAYNGAFVYSRDHDIRSYLNDVFLKDAFDNKERTLLVQRSFSEHGKIVCKYKVGLPSEDAMEKYLPKEADRKAVTTVYGKRNGVKPSLFSPFVPYWLVAAWKGDNPDTTFPYVDTKGKIKYAKNAHRLGIRPCIAVKVKKG